MTSVWPLAPGVFLPVHTEFRWTEITALDSYRPVMSVSGRDGDEGHAVPWIVCAHEAPGGVTIEVWRYHQPTCILIDRPTPGIMGYPTHPTDDAKAAFFEGTDDWKVAKVRRCEGRGCDRPLSLHQSARPSRAGQDECPACAARSILACVDCGRPDSAHCIGRESLLAAQRCLSCSHWRSRAKDPRSLVTPEFMVYGMGDGRGSGMSKGYGGHRWTIRMLSDGRTFTHDDLWSGERVPEYLRHLFVPNAEVKS